jgi:hypothetical protein
MGCCNKRLEQARLARKASMLRILEVEDLKKFNGFKNKPLDSLTNPLLLDYHRKTHMLYSSTMNRRPVNKEFIKRIVNLHDQYVNEMLKRGMQHNTPLKSL